MTMTATLDRSIDTGRLGKLLAGGLVGLIAFEVFGRYGAPFIMGGPLSPIGLVLALFKNFLGLPIGATLAHGVHYATGIVFYPLGYLAMTLAAGAVGVRLAGLGAGLVWGLVWGVVTWFLALGVFASLAGLPFMLNFTTITWVSLLGHLAYGLGAALVYELWR